MDNERKTLIELITKNLVDIKGKKRPIKRKGKSPLSIPSLLINLKINEAIEEAKEDSEESDEETIDKASEDKDQKMISGGYGTINKHYGMSPRTNYVSYDKIWGHMGSFKFQGYQDSSEERGPIVHVAIESTGVLVSNEVIAKAEKHFKYFVSGDVMGDIGFVPAMGISSVDWEKYRLMSQISFYRPILKLMNSVA